MVDYVRRHMKMLVLAVIYRSLTISVILELKQARFLLAQTKYERIGKIEEELIYLTIRASTLKQYIFRRMLECIKRAGLDISEEDLVPITMKDLSSGYSTIYSKEKEYALILRNGNIIPVEGNESVLTREISARRFFKV